MRRGLVASEEWKLIPFNRTKAEKFRGVFAPFLA